MSEKKSIKKNYVYNLLFQMLTLAIPLISTPYVSRVLGAEGIGALSYTQNNISYLILVGNFGIGLYATRQVAYSNDDPQKLKECFSNLIFTKLLTFIPVLAIYMGLVIYSTEYREFYLIGFINIIDALVDVSWYFNGQENFKITVVRGSLVKICGLIFIFCFVRKPEDVYLYVLILGLSQFIGNVLLFLLAFRRHGISGLSWRIIHENIRGGAILFVPQIASSLYFYCDKIMIKFFSTGIVENGYYEQSQKLIRLSTTVITALPTVMMPRIAAKFSKESIDDISDYMKKALEFVVILGLPMTFGLMGISDSLVSWFFGDEFVKVNVLLKIMAPIITLNSIYNVIGYQYFIAVKKEKEFTITILFGSVTNVILNFIFIPKIGSTGAAFASLVSELTIVFVQMFVILRFIKLDGLLKTTLKSIIAAVVMYTVIILQIDLYRSNFIATFSSAAVGIGVYTAMMFVLRNEPFIVLIKSILFRRGR